jgi:hypothetical protein
VQFFLKENAMNAKLISLTIAAALFAATSASAGQPNGRDSVYTTPGSSFPSAKAVRTVPGNGRGTVTANDLPAPTPKPTAVGEVKVRFGRT